MASSKEYLEFIIGQLSELEEITYRAMMGEFIIYYRGKVVGGIYDDRLLVKIVNSNKKYNMQESIPYESAKPMYLVDDIDSKEILRAIVLDTCKDLSNKIWYTWKKLSIKELNIWSQY